MLFITTLGFNFRSMLFFFGRLALRALLIWNDFRKRNYASKLRWSFMVAEMLWLFQQLDCLHLVLRMLCFKFLWNSKKTYNLEFTQGRHNFMNCINFKVKHRANDPSNANSQPIRFGFLEF